MISDQQIGKNIRNIREMKNYSQTALAEHLEVSQKQISRIEKGEVSVSIQLFFKICSALEIESDFLLEFDSRRMFNTHSLNPEGKVLKTNGIDPMEEMKSLYERLLQEKDERIRQLLDRIKV